LWREHYRRVRPTQPLRARVPQPIAAQTLMFGIVGGDVVVRFGTTVPVIAFRSGAFPELDFQLSNFDPAAAPDAVEAALRRFLQERVRRQG
jgi:hypothetical protein